jgi:transposase
MAKNPGVIKAVLDLHRQGYSVVAIAKSLNLHIEEIVNIINEYS